MPSASHRASTGLHRRRAEAFALARRIGAEALRGRSAASVGRCARIVVLARRGTASFASPSEVEDRRHRSDRGRVRLSSNGPGGTQNAPRANATRRCTTRRRGTLEYRLSSSNTCSRIESRVDASGSAHTCNGSSKNARACTVRDHVGQSSTVILRIRGPAQLGRRASCKYGDVTTRRDDPIRCGELRLDPLTGEWVNIVGHRQAPPEPPERRLPVLRRRARGARAVRRALVRQPLARARARRRRSTSADGRRRRHRDAPGGRRVRGRAVLARARRSRSRACRVAQVRKVVDLWAERTEALLARPEIEYVLVFENRGREVGATIDHPHGQIYGYPFVPPAPAREGDASRGARLRCAARRSRASSSRRAHRLRARRLGRVGAVRVGYAYGMRFAPRAHIGVAARARRRRRATTSPRCSSTRSGATTGSGPRRTRATASRTCSGSTRRPRAAATSGTCTRTSRRRCGRAGVPRYVASGELGSGTLVEPGRARGRGAGAARCLNPSSARPGAST